MRAASKNMTMSIICRIVSLISGLIVQRYLLLAFGSTLNGLTTSINQAMAYLVLLEAGLGTASVQALYDPLATGDWKTVSGIFTATGKEYKKISAIFVIALISISVLIPLAVSREVEFFTAGLLTFITGASYVVSYIMGGKYKALLDADRKIYVLYILDSISVALSCILRIAALKSGFGIIPVQLINLACIAIKNAGYVLYVRRKYSKVDYHGRPNIEAISKRWNVLIHSIAGIVVNNTDVVLLTIFGSLKTVSVYGVYNMVFSQLSSAVQTTFMQATQSSFGRIYHSDRKRYEELYELYEFVLSFVLFLVCSIAVVMILPFVEVYTAGVNDIEYVDHLLPILFALILLMNQIRIPALITINVAGHFKETQNGAILEAIINVVVSLGLFFFTDLGLYGLLTGTVCSYVYRTTDVILYTHKHLIKKTMKSTLKTYIADLMAALTVVGLFYIARPIHTVSFIGWLLNACCVSAITILLFLLINLAFNKKKIIETVCFLYNKVLKH